MTRILTAALFFLTAAFATGAASAPFDPGKASFTVNIDGLAVAYRVFAAPVAPGATVSFSSSVPVTVESAERRDAGAREHWTWTAPAAPGVYPMTLRAGDDAISLNMIVLDQTEPGPDQAINGFKIGAYPTEPFRGLASYRAPAGFIVVTRENYDLRVSPHFTLGQFLCKQESDWPKLAVLRPQLLIKLERLLERVNHAGIRTDEFVVMSGYRTPWYNRSIGNKTSSSRHLFGGAADIYIDVSPKDGVMDDLNGDGVSSKADADFLYDLIDGWTREREFASLAGGLASYKENAVHGPFVHVDERGYKARWGR